MSEWNLFDVASKDNMLRAIRRESDDLIGLASEPDCWERPTASGHWQVRDVVGHLVDTTEGYFDSFDAAHGRVTAPEALGVKGMNVHVDRGALAFRGTSQKELIDRLAEDRNKMLDILGDLDTEGWSGFMAPHKYMGPVPACVYAAGQLVDYAVHSWDIRQGTGQAHVLDGESADLLVPFAFIVWQSTAVCDEIDPFDIGVRLTGNNGGNTRVSVSPDGIALEPVEALEGLEGTAAGDLPCILEFDAASFVLTVFGRINAGTARGDTRVAERFANLFFRI